MKNICIIVDVPNWAFDNIALKLKKELSKKYNIKIEYFKRRDDRDSFFELMERIKNCDLIHVLNRRTLFLMNDQLFIDKIKSNGYNVEEYIDNLKGRITTSVYDYLNLNPEGIEEHKPIFNNYSKSYYTSTKKLYKIYSSIEGLKKPDTYIYDICDGEIFKPYNIERFKYGNILDRKIIIGWVGNSTHSGDESVDLKGFRTILKPAIEELKNEGYNIEGYYADRNEKWRSTEEMVEYYKCIDICTCLSIHEGTPRPILEAMYSGIPVISTDVGLVREVLGRKQKKFIIGDRDYCKNDNQIKNILKEKIIQLYNNRKYFEKLSKENLKSIQKFDGGKIIKDFEKFFDKNLM